MPVSHPLRTDPAYGPPCRAPPYLPKTDAGIRAAASENAEAYARDPAIKGSSADPAKLNGVDFLSVFAQHLPYWDGSKSHTLGVMHISAGQGVFLSIRKCINCIC